MVTPFYLINYSIFGFIYLYTSATLYCIVDDYCLKQVPRHLQRDMQLTPRTTHTHGGLHTFVQSQTFRCSVLMVGRVVHLGFQEPSLQR